MRTRLYNRRIDSDIRVPREARSVLISELGYITILRYGPRCLVVVSSHILSDTVRTFTQSFVYSIICSYVRVGYEIVPTFKTNEVCRLASALQSTNKQSRHPR